MLFIIREMAKYDTLRKKERNERIRRFHEANPDLSYREIGEIFQPPLTPQRIGQIIKAGKRDGSKPVSNLT